MKHLVTAAILVMAALLQGTYASAQYIHSVKEQDGSWNVTVDSGRYAGEYSASPMVADSGDLFYLTNPMRPLTVDQLKEILSDKDFEAYKKIRNTNNAGYALQKVAILSLLGSGTAGLIDLLGCYAGAWGPSHTRLVVYGAVASAGLVSAVCAYPLTASGKKQVEEIADRYNLSVRKDPSLAFGTTANGVGMALSF